MKSFAQLFTSLDQTTGTNKKVAALTAYFDRAPDPDKLWTIALLSSRRPKRTVTTRLLRTWAADLAGIPAWLFEESYAVVGDLAEAIALVLPTPSRTSDRSLSGWIEHIAALRDLPDDAKRTHVTAAWDQLDRTGRFIFNKIITGGFRMGVSQKLMTRALARHTGLDQDAIAYRLMGDWTPATTTYQKLVLTTDPAAAHSRPYPFYLASPLEAPPDSLGPPGDWQIERKWDGIRGQLVARAGKLHLWSRGGELITHSFPEFAALTEPLPRGTVLDGELLPWRPGDLLPLPFNHLQTRISRKKPSAALRKKSPVTFMAYDLLEHRGQDLRNRSQAERRLGLEALLGSLPPHPLLRLSPLVPGTSWDDLAAHRAASRQHHCEGLMIKHKNAPYRTGRVRGDWWKWKIDPLTIDAVMIYAMPGHGRRANLYTDYTFAVRDGDSLVPFTKAYSGLTDAEIRKVDAWVKRHTTERFGPVRAVQPELVMEIAFEGIQASPRHKSGIALRFPRIQRWRHDKPPAEANTLSDLQDLLASYG